MRLTLKKLQAIAAKYGNHYVVEKTGRKYFIYNNDTGISGEYNTLLEAWADLTANAI